MDGNEQDLRQRNIQQRNLLLEVGQMLDRLIVERQNNTYMRNAYIQKDIRMVLLLLCLILCVYLYISWILMS